MSQHPIDLLPEAVRARSLAGVRTGRYVAACVLAVLVLVVVATHVRLKLSRVQSELTGTEQQANDVLAAEAKIDELKEALQTLRDTVSVYERIAVPVSVSRVIATVVEELPPSVTIERFDIETQAPTSARSGRTRKPSVRDESQPRRLTAELAGFAATDQEVANLIGVLDARAPFDGVSLDFSRTRFVRGRTAREFRLSFVIDLDRSYDVSDASKTARGVAHVD